MGRCFRPRLRGDAINAVPAAAGANQGKLLGLYRRKAGRFVFALIRWYRNLIAALPDRRSLHPAVASMAFSGTTI